MARKKKVVKLLLLATFLCLSVGKQRIQLCCSSTPLYDPALTAQARSSVGTAIKPRGVIKTMV